MDELLLVDDEAELRATLAYNFRAAGYLVAAVETGEQALAAAARSCPDIVILDIGLPGTSGLEVCRELRSNPQTERVPILILSARDDVIDRVVALEIGADDYVDKPFSVRELLLRVEAVLRRSRQSSTAPRKESLRADQLELNPATRQCFLGDDELQLTQLEFDLLHTMMARPGRVQSRAQLLANVWKMDEGAETRTIDTHIKRLRNKLGDAGTLIRTYRGVGYSLQLPR
ncbi:MAG: response regulator transcription factor [Deltaproteobacteria bacterium]|nr:response regulator transcription factor [Deltaproteobacteria bacterium]